MTERIAIVGAGMAGLACARALAEAGRAAVVFEKSRGPGGRAATRRGEGPPFDHGAPGFRATRPGFAAEIAAWVAAGHAAPWPAAGQGMHTGLPGMSGIAAPLAAGLDLRLGARVTALRRGAEGWRLELGEDRAEGPFAGVALCVPAAQALALLEPVGDPFPALAGVEMEPCWTVMAAFAAPTGIAADRLEGDGRPLALALRQGGKPGRAAAPEAWVLHAGADWSRLWLEEPPEHAAAALTAAFAEAAGRDLPAPETLMVHRWRYARCARPLEVPCLWDWPRGLGAAGDWSGTEGIPDALASGRALALRILAR